MSPYFLTPTDTPVGNAGPPLIILRVKNGASNG
jgi:hypothetical protein